MQPDIIAGFLIGFLGTVHCLGMCGPLVLAYSLHIKPQDAEIVSCGFRYKNGINHHLAFHAGRIITYSLLGAFAALLFHLADISNLFKDIRGFMTLAGGLLMVFMGITLLRIFPVPGILSGMTPLRKFWSSIVTPLFSSDRIAEKVMLGLATGFLPCGLSWAMIVKSATTGNVLSGFALMAAFGLGTVPVLFMAGLSASVISFRTRIIGEKVAAASVIIMGTILVFKGTKFFA
jgi:sulfite exporter TauE/SafE